MGIIVRQSIKGTIWSYIGLVIGYVNLGIIMPQFFSADKIGLIQLFLAISAIFVQFSTLGFNSVTDRIFPYFRNKKNNHNGYLFLLIAVGLIGFTLSTAAFFILKPQLIESNLNRSPLIEEYIMLILPLILFKLSYSLLAGYNKVLFDTITEVFWSEFAHKIINLLLIIGVALGWLNFRQFLFGYIVSICMPLIPLIIVLIRRGDFNLIPNLGYAKKYSKEMITISAYGLFNGFSGNLVSNIDKLLVNHFLSLEALGIFSVCVLFARLISLPANSLSKISSGIIAQSWKENNTKHIQEIYYKASLNQMVIGLLIFIGILINIDTIFKILPEIYRDGKWVIIIYSFGILVSTINGMSGAIIKTSAHYRVLTSFIFLTFFISVISSLLLIPPFGIIGAAIATSITSILNSTAKLIFIKFKLGMIPFGKNHIIVLMIGFIAILLGFVLPSFHNWIITFLFKSSIVSLTYFTLIWKLNVSEEMNKLLNTATAKILNLKK